MGGFVSAAIFVGGALFILGWYLGRRRAIATERIVAAISREGREQADRVIVAVLQAQSREEARRRESLYAFEPARESDSP